MLRALLETRATPLSETRRFQTAPETVPLHPVSYSRKMPREPADHAAKLRQRGGYGAGEAGRKRLWTQLCHSSQQTPSPDIYGQDGDVAGDINPGG